MVPSPSVFAQLQSAFHETAAEVGAFANGLQAGVLIEDTSRRVLGCNARFCELLGIDKPASALGGADGADVLRQATAIGTSADVFLQRTDEIVASGQLVSSEVLTLGNRTIERDHLPIYMGSDLAGHLWQYRDVTEQRRASSALAASERRFEAMFQAAPLAISLSRLDDGTFLDVNPAFTSLLGYAREDVIGRTSTEIGFYVNPDTRRPAVEQVARGGTLRGAKVSVRSSDGVERELELSVSVIEMNGERCLLTIADDITERNIAQTALAESEAINRSILEALPDLMFRLKSDGTLLDYRPGPGFKTRALTEPVVGRSVRDLLPPGGARQVMAAATRALASKAVETLEYEVTRDGETYVRELRCVASASDEVIAIVRDITERTRAQAALAESEERFRLLAENAHDIIFRYRVAGPAGMEYISPSITKIAGYLPEDYYADPDFPRRVIHPDDRNTFDRMITQRLPGPVELRWLRKDSTVLWTEQTNVHIADEGGTLLAVEGVIRDITARRDTEQALRLSEERFRLLAENAHDIIFRYRVAEPRGTEYMSPSVARIAGYQPEDYYADPDFSLKIVHPEDAPLVLRMATLKQPETFKLRWLRKDGATVWAEQTIVPILDDDGALLAVEGVGRDITATVEAEEALQRARDELEGRVEREMVTQNIYDLTFREFTVLHHVVDGETDKVIAAALGISPLTVHKHVASILAKMGASSRTEASVRAIREGLLDWAHTST